MLEPDEENKMDDQRMSIWAAIIFRLSTLQHRVSHHHTNIIFNSASS